MDCCKYEREFDSKHAQKELRDFRKNGPKKSTRILLDQLIGQGISGMEILDIGSGIGVVHLGLLDKGASRATSVDASRHYQEAAKQEAMNRGSSERVDYHTADFVNQAERIDPADVVILDKVICCYPEMDELVRTSLAKTRRVYGIVVPRDTWWVKLVQSTGELAKRIWGDSFRTYIHPVTEIEEIISAAGFNRTYRRFQREWMIAVYQKGSIE